jgi:hypothetical protein
MSGIAGLAFGAGVKMIAGRALANAKADIAAIPPKAKLAIAGVLLLVVLFFVHQHVAHKRLKAAHDAGYAQGVAETKAGYARAQAQANAAASARTSKLRKSSDEDIRHIDRSADAVQLRGPGKAVCPGPAIASGAAGRHRAAGGSVDAGLDPVPGDGGPALIALPFDDTVAFAREYDKLRSEALTWRKNDELARTEGSKPDAR